VIFIEIVGDFVSSIIYNVFRDGIAIRSRRMAGRMVHTVSISCPSMLNLLKDLFRRVVDIK
jgi:hypothetical protein